MIVIKLSTYQNNNLGGLELILNDDGSIKSYKTRGADTEFPFRATECTIYATIYVPASAYVRYQNQLIIPNLGWKSITVKEYTITTNPGVVNALDASKVDDSNEWTGYESSDNIVDSLDISNFEYLRISYMVRTNQAGAFVKIPIELK